MLLHLSLEFHGKNSPLRQYSINSLCSAPSPFSERVEPIPQTVYKDNRIILGKMRRDNVEFRVSAELETRLERSRSLGGLPVQLNSKLVLLIIKFTRGRFAITRFPGHYSGVRQTLYGGRSRSCGGPPALPCVPFCFSSLLLPPDRARSARDIGTDTWRPRNFRALPRIRTHVCVKVCSLCARHKIDEIA